MDNKFPDVKCDVCGKVVSMESWGVIHGLTLCEEHLEQIEAIEKINRSFSIILCGVMHDRKLKLKL